MILRFQLLGKASTLFCDMIWLALSFKFFLIFDVIIKIINIIQRSSKINICDSPIFIEEIYIGNLILLFITSFEELLIFVRYSFDRKTLNLSFNSNIFPVLFQTVFFLYLLLLSSYPDCRM